MSFYRGHPFREQIVSAKERFHYIHKPTAMIKNIICSKAKGKLRSLDKPKSNTPSNATGIMASIPAKREELQNTDSASTRDAIITMMQIDLIPQVGA